MFQEITINNNMGVYISSKPPTKCIIPVSYELTGYKFSLSRAGTVSTEDGDLDVVLMLSNGISQLLSLDYLSEMLEMLEHFQISYKNLLMESENEKIRLIKRNNDLKVKLAEDEGNYDKGYNDCLEGIKFKRSESLKKAREAKRKLSGKDDRDIIFKVNVLGKSRRAVAKEYGVWDGTIRNALKSVKH